MRDLVLVLPGANDTEDFTALVFRPARFVLFSGGFGIPPVLVVGLDKSFSLPHPWARAACAQVWVFGDGWFQQPAGGGSGVLRAAPAEDRQLISSVSRQPGAGGSWMLSAEAGLENTAERGLAAVLQDSSSCARCFSSGMV